MWQRFTERARSAILVAQEEAVRVQSNIVTTEHLLLALLGETDSPASQFLRATGLRADALRGELTGRTSPIQVSEELLLSQEMKNLLGDAAQIAKELNHNDIDSHHLLLALLSNPKSEAAKTLKPPQPSSKELHGRFLEQLKEMGTLLRATAAPVPLPVSAKAPLFQRFTERSRRVILLAQEEAHRMESGYVGAEHLLLGMVCENEGSAAQMLISMGIKREDVRDAILALSKGKRKPNGEFALNSQAKRVLELSSHEANQLRHHAIGTEHLLLALLHPECGQAPLIEKLGLSPEYIRGQILEYLG